MDDQNQANNQFGNQPKKPDADVTTSAPVEAEPATDSSATPMPSAAPAAPQTPQSTPTTSLPVSQPAPTTPQPSVMPTIPNEEEKKLEMPPLPELLEAPKKNNMIMMLVVAALVVVLVVVGVVVYMAMQ